LWQRHPAYLARKLTRIDLLMDACTDDTDAEFWYNQFQKLKSPDIPRALKKTVTAMQLGVVTDAGSGAEESRDSESESSELSTEERLPVAPPQPLSASRRLAPDLLSSSGVGRRPSFVNSSIMKLSPLTASARSGNPDRRSVIYTPGINFAVFAEEEAAALRSGADTPRSKKKLKATDGM
jgi:hypothetical protein